MSGRRAARGAGCDRHQAGSAATASARLCSAGCPSMRRTSDQVSGRQHLSTTTRAGTEPGGGLGWGQGSGRSPGGKARHTPCLNTRPAQMSLRISASVSNARGAAARSRSRPARSSPVGPGLALPSSPSVSTSDASRACQRLRSRPSGLVVQRVVCLRPSSTWARDWCDGVGRQARPPTIVRPDRGGQAHLKSPPRLPRPALRFLRLRWAGSALGLSSAPCSTRRARPSEPSCTPAR